MNLKPTPAEWLNKHPPGRKPPCVRWIQSVSQVNIMLRVSTLDVWTPRCSNPCLEEWVNDLTNHFGENMTLFGLGRKNNLHPQLIHTDWFVMSSHPGSDGLQISFSCLPSWGNKPLSACGICIVKLAHLKPYLTYCLAADPSYLPLQKEATRCYVKRQWRVCGLRVIPGTCNFSLFGKRPSGIVKASM